jgi:hypothetical protein
MRRGLKMGTDPNKRIAVVTVHGTGDTAADPDGPPDGDHWFQTKSKFAKALRERLSGHGLDADIIPHLWSGANSATERQRGAAALAKRIKRLAKSHPGGVHVIGHSHGGNVANDAAGMLDWSRKQRRPKVASVVTVGTPFFRSRVTPGDWFGAWMFVIIVLLSILALPVITLAAGDSVTSALSDLVNMPAKTTEVDPGRLQAAAAEGARDQARPLINWLGANGFPVASGIALLFMFPLAFRGIGRIRRAGRRLRADTEIYSIWHPNDEAIAFLSRLEGLPIEPFPRWSLLRGSRTGGIIWGVRAIIIINLVGALLLMLDMLVRGVHVIAEPFQAYGTYVLIVGIVGAPLVFAGAYLLYRLFAAAVLELSLRGVLNNTIGGALVAIAFGRDADHRIDKVATCSHYYGTRQEVLADAVAARMLVDSAEASHRLFNKYRAGLFSVSTDGPNAIDELNKDAMTWASLIHTTYFRQDEVVASIGDYIASVAKKEAADV